MASSGGRTVCVRPPSDVELQAHARESAAFDAVSIPIGCVTAGRGAQACTPMWSMMERSKTPTAHDKRSPLETYQVLTHLGSGGMAEVYLALHRGAAEFQHLVVIKRIGRQFIGDESAVGMFVDEANTVAALNHPHIVKILDLRRVGPDLSIAMEYVDGESFGYVMQHLHTVREGFPYPLLCQYMVDVCEALHYAHTATAPDGTPLNLVHRDISPQNLMLDRNGCLKIIDFGIAKSSVQTDGTSTGILKGRFAYLAPDGLKSQVVDRRCDLYSLGLVFFEALTGRRAQMIKGQSFERLIQAVLNKDLPRASSLCPTVPDELDAIIAKATQKDREARYASAAEMAEEIRRFMKSRDMMPGRGEVQTWFQSTFKERIDARRALEQRVIKEAQAKESAGTADRGTASVEDSVTLPNAAGRLPYRWTSGTQPGMSGQPTRVAPIPPTEQSHPRISWGLLVLLLVGVLTAGTIVALVIRTFSTPPAPIAPNVLPRRHNLFVSSTPPSADLYLDSQWLGTTGPNGLTLYIEPGTTHTLQVARDGYMPHTMNLVGVGTGQQRVVAELEPLQKPEPPRPVADARAQKPAPIQRRAARRSGSTRRRKSKKPPTPPTPAPTPRPTSGIEVYDLSHVSTPTLSAPVLLEVDDPQLEATPVGTEPVGSSSPPAPSLQPERTPIIKPAPKPDASVEPPPVAEPPPPPAGGVEDKTSLIYGLPVSPPPAPVPDAPQDDAP